MRVLLITDNHNPSGGAENYFFDLNARLKKLPDLSVFSLGFGPQADVGDDFYILKSSRSKIGKLLGQIIFNPFIFLKLRRQIKKINPDIIHIHNIKQYSLSLLMAIKPYTVVQTMHDYSYICPEGQNIHHDLSPCPTGMRRGCFTQHQNKFNFLIYLFMAFSFWIMRARLKKIVKQFIVPSPLLADYLQKNDFKNVCYIPPFKTDARPNRDMKLDHFLFVGQLGHHKGVHLLVDEFALACRKNKHLMLKIAGIGPEEKVMRKKVQDLGLAKNIQFLGWRQDLASYYSECMAVIFPSIGMESFGLVLTESMAYQRPVIGINRGTSAWLIDDQQTGLLFDPLTRGDLAEKIQLINNLKFAKQLGLNAYEKLKLFNNEESILQIINIYRSSIIKQL